MENVMAEKKKAPAKKRSTKKAPEAAPPSHEAIAARAYEIWCETGGASTENWLAAEKELRGR